MKKISFADRVRFENSDLCVAFEYPTDDGDISGVVVELSGRYPDKGWVLNKEVKELVYVISGEGKLVTERAKTKFKQGDVLVVDRGEKFYWDGKCQMFMANTPAFSPEQHKEIE